MSEVGRSSERAEEQRRTAERTGHRSEGRAVKRDLPRSHLHRAARASRCPVSRLRAQAFRMGERHAAATLRE